MISAQPCILLDPAAPRAFSCHRMCLASFPPCRPAGNRAADERFHDSNLRGSWGCCHSPQSTGSACCPVGTDPGGDGSRCPGGGRHGRARQNNAAALARPRAAPRPTAARGRAPLLRPHSPPGPDPTATAGATRPPAHGDGKFEAFSRACLRPQQAARRGRAVPAGGWISWLLAQVFWQGGSSSAGGTMGAVGSQAGRGWSPKAPRGGSPSLDPAEGTGTDSGR